MSNLVSWLNILCSRFVQVLGDRANRPPPTVGEDILIVNASELSEGRFDRLLNKAAELKVPVLIKNYASYFGPMGKGPQTSDIIAYLTYQRDKGRPKATCQVQGGKEDKFDYDSMIRYFKSPPESRPKILNLLDNPVDYDPDLVEKFQRPEFIKKRDLIEFGIKIPSDSHMLRGGVKIPSYRRWLLVGSRYSVTGFHRDAMGFWTAVELQKGSKDWFWVEQNEDNVGHLKRKFQFGSVSEFTKIYHIRIEPGDVFIMYPGLIHAVVGSEDSFVDGTHFLLFNTLSQSLRLAKEDTESPVLTNDPDNKPRDFYGRLLDIKEALLIIQTFPLWATRAISREQVNWAKDFLSECKTGRTWRFNQHILRTAESLDIRTTS